MLIATGRGWSSARHNMDVVSVDLRGATGWTSLQEGDDPPPARGEAAVAFDPETRRLFMHGGELRSRDGSQPDDDLDVWVWDAKVDAGWTRVATTGDGPTGMFSRHSMIVDPLGRRLLFFGGYASMNPGLRLSNDVWALSLDGEHRWSKLEPAGELPSERASHTALFDPARQRMLVFGGHTNFGETTSQNDVWALSLSGALRWERLVVSAARPSPRGGHAAVLDSRLDRMVVYGGTEETDAWALSLASPMSWTRLSTTGRTPSARRGHAAIYDPTADRVVVFGGESASALWALQLAPSPSWVEVTSRVRPGTSAALRSDGELYLFGGQVDEQNAASSSDLRRLSVDRAPSVAAIQRSVVSPNGRSSSAVLYDWERTRLWVLGGFGSGGSQADSNDVWSVGLDEAAWQRAPMGESPLSQASLGAFYDAAAERFLVVQSRSSFMGVNTVIFESPARGELAWRELEIPGGLPGARHVVFDPTGRRLILTGLCGPFCDTGIVSLARGVPTFTRLSPTGTPPEAVHSEDAVYDPDGDRVLGFVSGGAAPSAQLWSLSLGATPEWSRVAVTGESPPARFFRKLVYDVAGHRLLALSGLCGVDCRSTDVWAFAPAARSWSRLEPTGTPPAPGNWQVQYDPANGRLVLLSGRPGEVGLLSLGDSPRWSTRWPSGASPAWDAGAGLTVSQSDELFVVSGDSSWRFDPVRSAWQPLAAFERRMGQFVSAFLDAQSERLLVLDRASCAPFPCSLPPWQASTIALEATPEWQERTVSGMGPEGSLVFDPARARVLALGGGVSELTFDNAPTWRVLPDAPGGPTDRGAAAFDEARDALWMVAPSGVWRRTLQDPKWSSLPVLNREPVQGRLYYDAPRDRLLVFAPWAEDPNRPSNAAAVLDLAPCVRASAGP